MRLRPCRQREWRAPSARIKVRAASARSRTTVREYRRRGQRRRHRGRSRPAAGHRTSCNRIRPSIMAKSAPLGSQVVSKSGPSSTCGERCGPQTAIFQRRSPGLVSPRSASLRQQTLRGLLERERPIVEHVAVARLRNAAGEPVEVGVLVGVQPHHRDDRRGNAGDEDDRRGDQGRAEPARGVDRPSGRRDRRARRAAATPARNAGCRCTSPAAARSSPRAATGRPARPAEGRRDGWPQCRDRNAATSAPAAPPKPSTRKISGSLSANSVGT